MEDPVHCPGLVEGGLVDGVEVPAGQGRRPVGRLHLADECLGGTVVGEPGADRPVAVLLLHGGRASDEGVLDRVVAENGRVAADIGHRIVGDE